MIWQHLGAVGFGALIGWYVYFVNRYRKGDVQWSDLTTLIGVIGGASVTALFETSSELFGAYGVGLAVGFFGYFIVLTILVHQSENFDSDWFLDGRRKTPTPPYSIPGEIEATRHPMALEPHQISLQALTLSETSVAEIAQVLRDAEALAQANQIKRVCEQEWSTNSDCNEFVKAVTGHFDLSLSGDADNIVDQITSAGWERLDDGVGAKKTADAGRLVIGGLKSMDHDPPRNCGHVVIVVAGGLHHSAYPHAYWGNSGGALGRNQPVTQAWRRADVDRVVYRAKIVR